MSYIAGTVHKNTYLKNLNKNECENGGMFRWYRDLYQQTFATAESAENSLESMTGGVRSNATCDKNTCDVIFHK